MNSNKDSIKWWMKEIVLWRKEKGFKTSWDNVAEKLLLIVSEITEAHEGIRHGDYPNFREEIADTMIRLLDLAESLEIDLTDEMSKKMDINWKRNWKRPYKHGKRFQIKCGELI